MQTLVWGLKQQISHLENFFIFEHEKLTEVYIICVIQNLLTVQEFLFNLMGENYIVCTLGTLHLCVFMC